MGADDVAAAGAGWVDDTADVDAWEGNVVEAHGVGNAPVGDPDPTGDAGVLDVEGSVAVEDGGGDVGAGGVDGGVEDGGVEDAGVEAGGVESGVEAPGVHGVDVGAAVEELATDGDVRRTGAAWVADVEGFAALGVAVLGTLLPAPGPTAAMGGKVVVVFGVRAVVADGVRAVVADGVRAGGADTAGA